MVCSTEIKRPKSNLGLFFRAEEEIRIPTPLLAIIVVDLAMPNYHLDRSAFKAQSSAEASNHVVYYSHLSWQERLEIAAYLTSVAFNYPIENPPKLDRTKFEAKSREL